MTRVLELLEQLVAFPTVSQVSNLDLIDWAQIVLQDAGFEITRLPGADPLKAGLHARIGPKVEGGICLSAHTDVVPVEGQVWTRDPFRLTREAGQVFGRGTTDMKGFIACTLAMAEEAKAVQLQKPLSIVLSYDEEVGCVGLREMMPRLRNVLGAPDVVIVGEPTSMRVVTGHKGKTALRVTFRGEAGHSALAPRFINAIHLAARFIDEIRALQLRLQDGPSDPAYDIPYTTVHIGRIAGGRALNIVPDKATLDMEFRYLAQQPPSEILAELENAAARVCLYEEAADAISIEETVSYPGLDHDHESASVTLLHKLSNGTETGKVAFGTEAGFFADLGLNALVLGPGDMVTHGHKPDEAISLQELNDCSKMMESVLRHLAY